MNELAFHQTRSPSALEKARSILSGCKRREILNDPHSNGGFDGMQFRLKQGIVIRKSKASRVLHLFDRNAGLLEHLNRSASHNRKCIRLSHPITCIKTIKGEMHCGLHAHIAEKAAEAILIPCSVQCISTDLFTIIRNKYFCFE